MVQSDEDSTSPENSLTSKSSEGIPAGSGTSTEYKTAENAKLWWVSLVPVVCFVGMLVSAYKWFPSSNTNIELKGISMASPAPLAKHYADEDAIRFECRRQTSIRAAIGGSIVIVPNQALWIENSQVTVSYEGLARLNVKAGQSVVKGEPIGGVNPRAGSVTEIVLRVFPYGMYLKPKDAWRGQ